MPLSATLNTLPHQHFEQLHSTNTALLHAIQINLHPHSHAILYTATEQTSGRGQHGRAWQGGLGNVFLSLYVPIGDSDTEQLRLGQLSGILSLAIGLFLLKMPILQTINRQRTQNALPLIKVKWANDLGIYDKGLGQFAKLGGVLIEPVFADNTSPVGVVIGVGLNVATAPKLNDNTYTTSCLHDLTDDSLPTAQELYAPICHALLQAVACVNTLDNPSSQQAFIQDYNRHHALQNQPLAIYPQNDLSTPSHVGRCVGINEQGGLLLQNKAGTTAIYAGTTQILKEINP